MDLSYFKMSLFTICYKGHLCLCLNLWCEMLATCLAVQKGKKDFKTTWGSSPVRGAQSGRWEDRLVSTPAGSCGLWSDPGPQGSLWCGVKGQKMLWYLGKDGILLEAQVGPGVKQRRQPGGKMWPEALGHGLTGQSVSQWVWTALGGHKELLILGTMTQENHEKQTKITEQQLCPQGT